MDERVREIFRTMIYLCGTRWARRGARVSYWCESRSAAGEWRGRTRDKSLPLGCRTRVQSYKLAHKLRTDRCLFASVQGQILSFMRAFGISRST